MKSAKHHKSEEVEPGGSHWGQSGQKVLPTEDFAHPPVQVPPRCPDHHQSILREATHFFTHCEKGLSIRPPRFFTIIWPILGDTLTFQFFQIWLFCHHFIATDPLYHLCKTWLSTYSTSSGTSMLQIIWLVLADTMWPVDRALRPKIWEIGEHLDKKRIRWTLGKMGREWGATWKDRTLKNGERQNF